jgi:large subunit ribosomal protein L22
MVSKATVRYIRISPRKTRLVANVIKGKNVGQALAILSNLNKRACGYLEELLKSAISNAKRDPDIDQNNLFISKLLVDGGPMMKRFKAGSMGRAMMIRHRMSHITIELDTTVKPNAEKPKETKKKRSLLRRRK